MDPDNPVVKLCATGMEAEFDGRLDDSRLLFLQAWQAAQDDYEACIAAHFVARRQADFADNLDALLAAVKPTIDAGGILGVDWDVASSVLLRGSAMVQTSVTTGRDLGGRALLELVARR